MSSIQSWLRPLVRRPGITLVILATLAVGIGANTAIFSFVHGVLMQPLPYPEPQRLYTVWEDHTRRDGPPDEWTGATTFLDWRSDNRSFDELAAYTGWTPNLTGDGVDPEQLAGLGVSPGWFRVLGVTTAHGRLFHDDDSVDGAEPTVILSHNLWQRRFGGDSGIVGRPVSLDDRAVTVVGVLAADFQPLLPGTEIWRPFTFQNNNDRGSYFLRVIGRLRQDLDAETAARDMDRIAALVAERAPEYYKDVGIRLIPLHERLVGTARPAILALAGAVGLLLLVACANVANLLLVDAVGRGPELAVRASLGAGRGLLVARLIRESLVLAVLGGAAGLALGAQGIQILVARAPAGTPRIADVGLHPPVVAFALGLTLVTGLAAGLLPALRATRFQLADALRPGTRVEGRDDSRLRSILVVAETALALCLLAGSGLLIRSFWGLTQVDLGFQPQDVVTTNLVVPRARYEERADRVAFYQQLTERLGARPEIQTAAATSVLPMAGGSTDSSYYVEGAPFAPPGQRPAAWYRMVTPDYYQTLGIELAGGRPFNDRDVAGQPGVVAVSERFARRWFGNEEALGKRMKFGGQDSDREWMTIVAVVRDVRDRSALLPHRDDIYLPHAQWGNSQMTVVVRARGGVEAVMPTLLAEARQLDPALPLTNASRLSDLVAGSLWLPRLSSQVITLFALAALILAGLGLYGVLAHSVQLRRRELGIRQALGADRQRLLALVLGQGLRMAGGGLAVGLVLTWALGSTLDSLLHNVSPRDPGVLALTAAVLLAAAALASWIPALRAAGADPAVCLRDE